MNFFFRWAHAAAGELWQDETSHRVSSRTSEAQFPAHLCPPFPLTVSSASPPRALRPLSLFLSHIARPSPKVQLCAGCLCLAEKGQHVLCLALGTRVTLARTQCWSPS